MAGEKKESKEKRKGVGRTGRREERERGLGGTDEFESKQVEQNV